MGTRGIVGFHKGGVDKVSYNHFDSYPRELGNDVKKFLMNHSVDDIRKMFDDIVLVSGTKGKPTPEQIEECKKYANIGVGSQDINDWYCLLHEAQGNLEAFAQGLRYMIDSHNFLKDSVFCEWGYIINLEKEVLEIYKGFQKSPQYNRFFTPVPDSVTGEFFYNCQLIKEVPLFEITNFDMDKFEEEIAIHEAEDSYYKKIGKALISVCNRLIGRCYVYISDYKVKPFGEYQYSVTIKAYINSSSEFSSKALVADIKDEILKDYYDKKEKIIRITFGKTTKGENWSFSTPVKVEIKPR